MPSDLYPQHSGSLTIECDGDIRHEPLFVGCWAWIAFDEDGREIAHTVGWVPDCQSSNRMEYVAVLEALRWVQAYAPGGPVLCRSDSFIVVHQSSEPPPYYPNVLNPYREQVNALLTATGATLTWIPGRENRRADRLCQEAVKAYVACQPGPKSSRMQARERGASQWQRLKELHRKLGRPKSVILGWLLDHAPWHEAPEDWQRLLDHQPIDRRGEHPERASMALLQVPYERQGD